MTQRKALFIDLISSAVGLIFCIVAMATPGFYVEQKSIMSSIFYARICESDSCSTKSYAAIDEEKNYDGELKLGMIDVQLESLLAVVLGGVGWVILLLNILKRVSLPSKFVTGGIFLLVAGTSEFAVLVRFIASNAAGNASLKSSSRSLGVPYSLILASLGIVFILLAVVRIFIRHNRHDGHTEINQQMTNEPRSNITGNRA